MLKFFNLWTALTLLLFYIGPIPWGNRDDPTIALYVLTCVAFFNFGARLFGRRLAFSSPVFKLNNGLQYFLIVLFIILSAEQVRILSGKSIFNPFDYSLEFGNIYEDFYKKSAEAEGGILAFLITIVKMSIFPLILYIFCESLGKDWKKLALIGFPFVASSLMRGTDKELMDLAILVFVAMFYKGMINRRTVALVLLLPLFLFLFLVRRVDRYGGYLPPCLADRITCFDFQGTLGSISPSLEILYVFITSYITQGYYALGLTFGLDAEWGMGVGHLPPVKSVLCSNFDLGCTVRDYQYALDGIGWDPLAQWTSVYPILANDFTFYGVQFFFLVIGIVFRAAEAEWIKDRSIYSLCTLIIITQFFIFSSANMQIAISVDWVVATVVFLYVPIIRFVLFAAVRR